MAAAASIAAGGGVAFPYQFSTKRLEPASGLLDFGARWYDPAIGRFISPDPAGFTDGPNLYPYVANDPVNMIDPVGLSRWDIGARTTLSVFQRGMAGALSVMAQPVEQLTSQVFRLYDANRGVFVQLEGHTYQVLRPFQHLKSAIQGLGLFLGGLNIVIDPIELTAQGKLNVTQAREMIVVRGLETVTNVAVAAQGMARGAAYGFSITGTPAGSVVGAVLGGIAGGTTSAWLTRKAGNWTLESLDVPR